MKLVCKTICLFALLATPATAANFFDYGSGQNFFDYGASSNFWDYGSGLNFFGYGDAPPAPGTGFNSEITRRRRQQIRIPAIPQ